MTDVTIADLGLGNVRSVVRAFERADCSVTRTSDAMVVRRASRVVVSGQGAFGDGAKAIRTPLGDAIRAHVDSGRPYLGICLGMQLLFAESDESPGAAGFGVLKGRVSRLSSESDQALKIPHMGWNQVESRHSLVADNEWFYFVHSFVCVPGDERVVAGQMDYGGPRCAAVARGPLFACQFHPEKSQGAGLRLLRGFVSGKH